MILRKLKSTSPICAPQDRQDFDIVVREEAGIPVGNDLAIDVYNNPETYAGIYEIIP